MKPLVKQSVVLLAILVILAVLPHLTAERRAVYQFASVIVVALAFVTGLKLVFQSTHALVAWILACLVVPCFLLVLGIVGPNEPEKFVDIAYLFGTLYGAVAGGGGVLVGMALRRRRLRAKND